MTFLIWPKKYRNWSVRSGAVTPNWIMLPTAWTSSTRDLDTSSAGTWWVPHQTRLLSESLHCPLKHCNLNPPFFFSLLLLQPHISLMLENYDLVKIGAGLRSALKLSQWVIPFPKASHWSWQHHFLPLYPELAHFCCHPLQSEPGAPTQAPDDCRGETVQKRSHPRGGAEVSEPTSDFPACPWHCRGPCQQGQTSQDHEQLQLSWMLSVGRICSLLFIKTCMNKLPSTCLESVCASFVFKTEMFWKIFCFLKDLKMINKSHISDVDTAQKKLDVDFFFPFKIYS